MSLYLRQICVLSVFFGLIMLLVPEGSVKRLTTVLCTVILMTLTIEAAKGFDFDSYALALSRYRDDSAALETQSQLINRELNRSVIEENCEAYIKDKGRMLGTEVQSAEIELQWSMEGLWCPVSVHIYSEREKDASLVSLLEAELGIPGEAIYWN